MFEDDGVVSNPQRIATNEGHVLCGDRGHGVSNPQRIATNKTAPKVGRRNEKRFQTLKGSLQTVIKL